MGNNNSNQKKTKPNYFSTNINRFGESFLDMKNSRDIQNDAPRIFRELARKNINLEVYGHFFLDKHFLENLIEVAKNKVIFHNTSFQTMNYAISVMNMNRQPIDQNIIDVAYTHKNIADTYNVIYYYLKMIENSNRTNIIPLYNLSDVLYRNATYKNSII